MAAIGRNDRDITGVTAFGARSVIADSRRPRTRRPPVLVAIAAVVSQLPSARATR
ncbi:hypothetical protein HNR23_002361 [Nocardiopsis mwathae]|uniref:Uncharacterized protein n=1 Tax=Nocardiopsis mwathae TaxID=1472723 RepID=A0A7W9YJF1_9ACTN|nr:hypothetical protein [Nocardiopsis mwathae]MBB6172301.1 hypothetical protein [Nocardiopsis mwathae]